MGTITHYYTFWQEVGMTLTGLLLVVIALCVWFLFIWWTSRAVFTAYYDVKEQREKKS